MIDDLDEIFKLILFLYILRKVNYFNKKKRDDD